MQERTIGTFLGSTIALSARWMGADLVRDVMPSAASPRAVTPGGSLSDYEQQTVEILGGLSLIPVGRSADLVIGQAVFAIGNPFSLDRTLTSGVVSALDRRLPTSAGREVVSVIQTDASYPSSRCV